MIEPLQPSTLMPIDRSALRGPRRREPAGGRHSARTSGAGFARVVAMVLGVFGLVTGGCSDRGDAKAVSDEPAPGLGAALEEVTGTHTRVVWAWHQNEDKGDPYQAGNSHLLVGFDSRDPAGIRVILEKKDNYSRPLISPDGQTILFSDKNVSRKGGKKHFKPKIYSLPWQGGKDDVVDLGSGLAVDIWRDPESGEQWVYAIEDLQPTDRVSPEGRALVRFRLDEPEGRETLFKGRISPDNVQISGDGRMASGLFPWPKGGLVDLESGKWRQSAHGCWTSMAPDGSHVSWVFDGAHRNARMFGPTGKRRWTVKLNTAPGIDGAEVYHPRWSNHPRIFTITGPYGPARDGNPISKSSPTAEVYVGRFDAALTKAEAWVKLTENDTGDFYPDVWVAGGSEVSLDLAALPQEDAEAGGGDSTDETPGAWPGAEDSLVVRWLHDQADNRIGERDCSVEARGIGRFGREFDMILDGGWFVADGESGSALSALLASGEGFTVSFLLTESLPEDGGAPPVPMRIVALEGPNEGVEQMAIVREVDRLIVRVAGREVLAAAVDHAESGAPTYWTASLAGGRAAFLRDGALVAETDEAPVLPAVEGELRLTVGDPAVDPGPYRGRLRALTVHGGVLPADVVASQHAGILTILDSDDETEAPEQVVVRGRLVEASGMPTVESLDTYRRALFDFTYEVEEVISGEYGEDRIVVWHWAILDRQPLVDALRDIGSSHLLTLEPASAHPQLEGERRAETTSEFALEPYYDVSTPPRPGS